MVLPARSVAARWLVASGFGLCLALVSLVGVGLLSARLFSCAETPRAGSCELQDSAQRAMWILGSILAFAVGLMTTLEVATMLEKRWPKPEAATRP